MCRGNYWIVPFPARCDCRRHNQGLRRRGRRVDSFLWKVAEEGQLEVIIHRDVRSQHVQVHPLHVLRKRQDRILKVREKYRWHPRPYMKSCKQKTCQMEPQTLHYHSLVAFYFKWQKRSPISCGNFWASTWKHILMLKHENRCYFLQLQYQISTRTLSDGFLKS